MGKPAWVDDEEHVTLVGADYQALTTKRRGEGWTAYAERLGSEYRLEGKPFLGCPFPPGFLREIWRKAYKEEDRVLRTGKLTGEKP